MIEFLNTIPPALVMVPLIFLSMYFMAKGLINKEK